MSVTLTDLVAELKEEEALSLVEARLAAGEDPKVLLDEGSRALDVVGRRFDRGEYFIPDLIFGGEIMAAIAARLKPHLQTQGEGETRGCFLIGTVENDIHDIGKDIVSFLLGINGFKVVDLGVNVPKEAFVRAILEHDPDIVGISGLLTSVFEDIKQTIEAIDAEGLRTNGRKIIIGGGQIDADVCTYTGADAFATDAGIGVELAIRWIEGNH
jgi:methanogenic corrinoid protein MtbC1